VRRALPILVLLLVGGAVVAVAALSKRPYGSDALFYEAQVEELQGASREESLAEWFGGSEARDVASREDEPEDRVRVLEPGWPEYADQFYRRRWVVQGMGALADAIVPEGDRLLVVSWLGYLLIGPLLFLLLRQRFGVRTSLLVSLVCILLPPVVEHGTLRGVDSWGLALLIAALLFLVLALDRGLRWLPAFAVTMAALSFTRDNTLVALAAIFWLLVVERRDRAALRRHAALAAAGLAAALPAPLLFGAPLREQLAWVINDFEIPDDTSWGFVLTHLPEELARAVYFDLRYVTEHAFTPLATPLLALMLALLAAALAWLALGTPREDPYFRAMRAGLVGGLALLVMGASYGAFRLELVLVPAAGVGAAHWLESRLVSGPNPAPAPSAYS
jgi:Dolichyl-phosphate-mannose-protein mannosyltransferase